MLGVIAEISLPPPPPLTQGRFFWFEPLTALTIPVWPAWQAF